MVELGGRERTTKEWIDMAQEIKDAGSLGLLLTGGEPMLRPDFADIYREIAQMGFVLTLYTNATLVTPEIIRVLQDYPPHTIGITIYGASYETYERVTGNGVAYYKMLEGVSLLQKLPSKFTIRSTIIKDNFEDLDKVIRLTTTFGKGVEFNVSRIVTKQVRGGISDVESCRLTPEQNVAVQEKIKNDYIIAPICKLLTEETIDIEERKSIMERVNGKTDIDMVGMHKKKTILYGCSAGLDSFTITWDGKLIGCQLLEDCWTDPFIEGFNEAWKSLPSKIRLPEISEQCKECKTSCCACPATRLAETGSLGGWPGYICKEGKLKEEMYNKLLKKLSLIILRKESIYESL
jgi:MoaA/NifB/PqqE/SkfB family radical SAM enzyme